MSTLSERFAAARAAAEAKKAQIGELSAALQRATAPQDHGPSAPHIIVVARAGTGKTTTLIEGLKKIRGEPVKITPSEQQAAVWRAMELSTNASSICFCAFNKAIATELQSRVPKGCDAMTMHSMGYKAVLRAFPCLKGKRPSEYRTQEIMEVMLGTDIREFRKKHPVMVKATEQLVGLCKQNLVSPRTDQVNEFHSTGSQFWNEELDRLASHYQVEMRSDAPGGKDYRDVVYQMVPGILEKCKAPNDDRMVDYNDMIWLPVVLNLPVYRYDLTLVDECQDLNRCQQELAMKAGRRLILCGDDRQAIYGFAGADSKSMKRMEDKLRAAGGVEVLPLTVTRRCGRAIVKEANKIVEDFHAHETCCDGEVAEAMYPIRGGYKDQRGEYVERYELPWDKTYCAEVKAGDMILCRVNAPLVSQCFRFIMAGVLATIRGRDIGAGLIQTIEKLHASSVEDLISKVTDWVAKEVSREQAKRTPDEAKIIASQDRGDCILAFTEAATTLQDVIDNINLIFSDEVNKEAVVLSSVHKAKGLESDTVFILMPRGASMPHSMARSDWQIEQEYNLKYVAITRAIQRLVWVT